MFPLKSSISQETPSTATNLTAAAAAREREEILTSINNQIANSPALSVNDINRKRKFAIFSLSSGRAGESKSGEMKMTLARLRPLLLSQSEECECVEIEKFSCDFS
jgi:hypothetical protein